MLKAFAVSLTNAAEYQLSLFVFADPRFSSLASTASLNHSRSDFTRFCVIYNRHEAHPAHSAVFY